MPQELIPTESIFQILRERWTTLIPLFVLIAIVLANTLFKYNIFTELGVLARFWIH